MPRQTLTMENPLKKILTKISAKDLVISAMCFMLSKASILTYLTPFGLAFFASSFSCSGWFYALLAGSIGAITSHSGSDCVRYIISIALTSAVLGLFDLKKKTFFKALTVSLIYFLVSLFLLAAGNFILYDFIIQSFESFLCFVSVYAIDSVIPVITNYKKRTFLSHKEIIGVIFIFAILTMSLSSANIFGMNIDSLISIFIIMAISYRGDILISSLCGTIFGLSLALSRGGGVHIAGAFALAGLGAGFFSRYSRLGVVLGVTLANAVITAFMNNTANILINPVEVLAAGFVFATMPKKTVDIFTDFVSKASGASYSKNSEKIKSSPSEKLLNMADAFNRLAQVYRSDCYMRHPGNQYMTKLFDYIAHKNCSDCSKRFDCWQKSKQSTYAYMTSMLEIASSNGSLKICDMPKRFADKCIRKEDFEKCFNFMYDIYKTDKLWLEKMYEARLLMVSQTEGISNILKCAANHEYLNTNPEGESYILAALDSEGIRAKEVNVFEKDGEIKQINIILGERKDEKYLAEIISDAMDMPFFPCKIYETDIDVRYEICPCGQYIVQWAKVFACKSGETVCGDSFVWLSPESCSSVMAISDGMGSGKSAFIQSRDTLEMLSSFLEAGFDTKTSFELINSSLLLRSAKDCFSTIDMMSINTKTGVVELSKIGAAPTYVKQGNTVKCYECSTLPAGILRDVSAQFYHFSTENHTMVVMMSDGISNTVIKTKNDWIETELKSLSTHSPDLVARKILDKAIKKSGGRIEDDMTVAVAVIYRNE